MRSTVTRKNKDVVLVIGLLLGVFASSLWHANPTSAQSNVIAATICTTGSTITITQPVSDSTVTEPSIPLQGTVSQANQIEVYVNDVLDSVIPLSIGQISYSSTVQVSPGTHTIKVVAINSCPGADGSASSVVTYQPPPDSTPSTGSDTPTGVGDGTDGSGVVIGPDDQVQTDDSQAPLLPKEFTAPLESAMHWLNINTGDTKESATMPLWRAAAVGAGLYLVIVGVAASAVQFAAGIPAVAAVVPGPTLPARVRFLTWAFRGVGAIALLVGLFL